MLCNKMFFESEDLYEGSGWVLRRQVKFNKKIKKYGSAGAARKIKRESGLNPEQPPLLYLTQESVCHWIFSEKAALPFEKGFTSQETCRIFQGSHSFGEKSAAVYQHGIQVCGTAAPVGISVPVYAALFPENGRSFFVFGEERDEYRKEGMGSWEA